MGRPRRLGPRLLRLAVLLVVLGGTAALLLGLDLRRLGQTLRQAAPLPLVAAAALNFALLALRAAAWQAMLGGEAAVGFWRLWRYTVATAAATAVTPLRAGEALRVWLLAQRDAVPVGRGVACAALEKLLDAVAMALVVLPLPLLMPQLPPWVQRGLGLLSALAAAAALALGGAVVWARRGRGPVRLPGRLAAGPGRGAALGRALAAGLGRARALLALPLPRLALALAALTAAWGVDLAMVRLCLAAVDVALPPAAGLLVLLLLNMAIAVPSTPGHVGALELGAVAALQLLGVARGPALAFALVYHATQVLPLLVAGLVDGRFIAAALRGARAETAGRRPHG